MDTSIFASLGVWTWFAGAGILMILELVIPGTFLFWLGLAAAATGLVGLLVDLSWQREALLFAILAVGSVLVGRNVMRRKASAQHDRPFLNRRMEALVGREFVLAEPIVDGAGRVRIDDTIWRVVGSDFPAGTRIKVARIDGSTLVVEKA
jgi:inner membrane protein